MEAPQKPYLLCSICPEWAAPPSTDKSGLDQQGHGEDPAIHRSAYAEIPEVRAASRHHQHHHEQKESDHAKRRSPQDEEEDADMDDDDAVEVRNIREMSPTELYYCEICRAKFEALS